MRRALHYRAGACLDRSGRNFGIDVVSSQAPAHCGFGTLRDPMTDRFADRSPDRPTDEELRADAAFRAGQSGSGIGVAVVRSDYRDGEPFWECIVTDGKEWHFIEVIGVDLGAFPDVGTNEIEQGIERFAATLPDSYRLGELLGANPLHVDKRGTVTD
jgi:hypothetical protein